MTDRLIIMFSWLLKLYQKKTVILLQDTEKLSNIAPRFQRNTDG